MRKKKKKENLTVKLNDNRSKKLINLKILLNHGTYFVSSATFTLEKKTNSTKQIKQNSNWTV